MQEQNIILTTEKNLVEYLKLIVYLFENNYDQKWIWSIIAFDQAIYTLCIGILLNGNPDNVTIAGFDDTDKFIFGKSRNDRYRQIVNYIFKNSNAYTITWESTTKEFKNSQGKKLIGFWTAIARVLDYEFWNNKEHNKNKLIKLTNEEWKSLIKIHEEYRNELIHFSPKLTSFSIYEVKQHLLTVSLLIKNLLEGFGYILVFRNENSQDEIHKSYFVTFEEVKVLVDIIIKYLS